MVGNKNLHNANKAKKDEFYTQMTDIAVELKHYKSHFKGKVVLCNCDDPFESNFFKFFALKFNDWGIKKLICTCYNGSSIAGKELDLFNEEKTTVRNAYKVELTELSDVNGDGATDLLDVKEILKSTPPTLLKGNGDFRSSECIELLKEADIVVTNPPFSLFREYIAQLVEYQKDFLVIGNLNSITCKEIFPLIINGIMWFGPTITSGDREFSVPDSYPLEAAGCRIDENGKKYIRVKGVRWFTNLDHKKRHEELDLYKTYSAEEYPKLDNFDAIFVSKTSDIPMDYDGIMAVPITFMDKYCPEQFEILGLTQIDCHDLVPDTRRYGDYREIKMDTGKPTRSSGNKTNENAVLLGKGNKKTYYINKEGRMVHSEYKRMFIRKIV
jgi:hypothetical protein